jgi:hypothetical protein
MHLGSAECSALGAIGILLLAAVAVRRARRTQGDIRRDRTD